MCGIVGFSGKKDHQVLTNMLQCIVHRGPDGEGMYEGEDFTIGMRRLAIIDPKSGWQPIWNEDESIAIVFNGEIYNYQELWKELEALGHKFRSNHSDTETIVHGYEEWGYDVVKKLRGMFAFAIYDLKKKQIFIARDRLGIKPLYYTKQKDRVYFASEIKALVGVIAAPLKANKTALYEYLMYRTHDHREQTFFNDVLKLAAGHYMVLNPDGTIKSNVKYWEPEINLDFYGNKSDQTYGEELRALFSESVESHLISDVPVGVTLSGGLDSTGVVSVMAKLFKEKHTDLHTKNVTTFSAVYPGDPIDETKYIDLAAKFAGVEQHYITPNPDNFWNEIDNWIYTQEEPTISSAPYAIYCVMREASKYVKAMLSGQGGDELFAGYIPYFASYATSALDNHKYLELSREIIQGFDLYYNYFKQKLNAKFDKGNYLSMNNFLNKAAFGEQNFVYETSRNLNQRLFQDITQYSIPNVLRYEDKNAMAFSIETRVPFLDHKFVEYVLKLPIDQKIKYGWNRYVYRNAMKGLIPEEIRKRRKKIGFTTPEARWLKQNSAKIMEIFASKALGQRGLYNQEQLISDYQKWLNGELPGDGLILWRILNTELWMRRFNISI